MICRCLPALALSFLLIGCANPADDKPAAVVSDPKPETSLTATDAESTEPGAPGVESTDLGNTSANLASVSADTVVLPISGETGKIEFTGSKVTGKHDGGFKTFDGTLTLAINEPKIEAIATTIDMSSTWSDSDNLTGHLMAPDFFDVKQFPTSKFVTTEITPLENRTDGATHTLTGNLTLHGVTKSISFPATLAVTDDAATVDSVFVLNRKDFGIVYEGKADDLVRDEVVIKLAIKAPRNAA